MKLKKMFEDLKKYKANRCNWRMKWRFRIEIDDAQYVFAFLPTIAWQPWPYRYPNSAIVDVCWLHFHICFGKWERVVKEEENGDGV